MNINSFLNSTIPTSPLSGSGYESGVVPMSKNKREAEVVAAAALASLVTDGVSPYLYLRYQQSLRQPQQKKQGQHRIEIPERLTKYGRKRAVPFPLKLMQVLADEQYSHIISWMPNGRSFVIIRPRSFVQEILPKHFKSAQYASFTRKLTRWGFLKCEDGTGEFFHPQFRKGRVDLAEKITCQGNSSSRDDSKIEQAKKKSKEAGEASTRSHVSTDDNNSVASSTSNEKSEVDEDEETSTSDKDDRQHKVTMFTSAKDMNMRMNTEYRISMELEQMKLHRCIRAAALSRQALAQMQRHRGLAPSLHGSRAYALAAGGFPKLPSSGINARLHPWCSSMLSPTAATTDGRLFLPFNSPSLALRRPNTQGAKTA